MKCICAPPKITWTGVWSLRDSCKAKNISLYDSIFVPSLSFPLLFSDSISLSDVLPVCHSGAEDEDCQREQSVLIKDMPDPQPQEILLEGNTEITSSTTATETEKCVSVDSDMLSFGPLAFQSCIFLPQSSLLTAGMLIKYVKHCTVK